MRGLRRRAPAAAADACIRARGRDARRALLLAEPPQPRQLSRAQLRLAAQRARAARRPPRRRARARPRAAEGRRALAAEAASAASGGVATRTRGAGSADVAARARGARGRSRAAGAVAPPPGAAAAPVGDAAALSQRARPRAAGAATRERRRRVLDDGARARRRGRRRARGVAVGPRGAASSAHGALSALDRAGLALRAGRRRTARAAAPPAPRAADGRRLGRRRAGRAAGRGVLEDAFWAAPEAAGGGVLRAGDDIDAILRGLERESRSAMDDLRRRSPPTRRAARRGGADGADPSRIASRYAAGRVAGRAEPALGDPLDLLGAPNPEPLGQPARAAAQRPTGCRSTARASVRGGQRQQRVRRVRVDGQDGGGSSAAMAQTSAPTAIRPLAVRHRRRRRRPHAGACFMVRPLERRLSCGCMPMGDERVVACAKTRPVDARRDQWWVVLGLEVLEGEAVFDGAV